MSEKNSVDEKMALLQKQLEEENELKSQGDEVLLGKLESAVLKYSELEPEDLMAILEDCSKD